jgi:predicted transcriptional regulator
MAAQDELAGPGATLLPLAARITRAYVARNAVAASALPALIAQVHESLRTLAAGVNAATERPKPAIPIGRSVQRDHIVCLEDGRKLKMLKRHLRANYGLTPEEYRRRWGLAADYPMVAPAYAERRSAFAKQIGLGRRPG